MTYGAQHYTKTLSEHLFTKEPWRHSEWTGLIDWCDHESYDNLHDEWDRLELFVDELKKQIKKHKENNNE